MPPTRGRILYLHGFASSPHSKKATYLASALRELGFDVEIPALDQGDFAHLTITRQLAYIQKVVGHDKVDLIGSSLGGYLAALFAARHPAAVSRLVLLAPAFDFSRLWHDQLGPEKIAEWRQTKILPVFHYQAQTQLALSPDLIDDAAVYEPFPHFAQLALLFHGRHDPLVPIALSEHFAATHPNVQLIPLSSAHELTDVLSSIWQRSKDFLLDARI